MFGLEMRFFFMLFLVVLREVIRYSRGDVCPVYMYVPSIPYSLKSSSDLRSCCAYKMLCHY